MTNRNRSQRGMQHPSWQNRNSRNPERMSDWDRSENYGYGHVYDNDGADDQSRYDRHSGDCYNQRDEFSNYGRNYNHDVRAGFGTNSYRGGTYEGGYSNSDYRDNDRDQRSYQGNYNRDADRDYDRGNSQDYNQSRQGQGSTYGLYGNQGSSNRYNTGDFGGSHYSSDYDRYNRGQWGTSFDRSNEGSSGWPESNASKEWTQNNERSHRGKGPKGYQRSDDRIKEDINDRLSDSHDVDASDIEVTVSQGEVTLTGTVQDRREKRKAEDLVESVSGVKNVENRIRLKQSSEESSSSRTPSTQSSKSTPNGSRKHSVIES